MAEHPKLCLTLFIEAPSRKREARPFLWIPAYARKTLEEARGGRAEDGGPWKKRVDGRWKNVEGCDFIPTLQPRPSLDKCFR